MVKSIRVTKVGPTMEDRLTASNSGCVCQGQRVIILHKLFSLLLIYSVLYWPYLLIPWEVSLHQQGLSASFFKACFLKHYKCASQQFKDHPL